MNTKNFSALAAWAVCMGLSAAALAAQVDAVERVPAMNARLAANVPLTSVARAGNALVAVGDHGMIVRSVDDGATWQQASVPVSTLLTEVDFADDRLGWAVGHGGVILATTDGGLNWTLQKVVEGDPALLSVHFLDADRGYVTGAYGTALRTTDGGRHWEPMAVGQGLDADYHLNHLFSTHDGTLYIAGESGLAFRSTDGGASWTKLDTGVSGSLWSGLEYERGEVLLLGMTGKVIASRDGGVTWQERDTGTEQSLTSGISIGGDRLIVVGSGGAVLRENDDGPFQLEIRADRQNLAAVALAPNGTVIVTRRREHEAAMQQGDERAQATTPWRYLNVDETDGVAGRRNRARRPGTRPFRTTPHRRRGVAARSDVHRPPGKRTRARGGQSPAA